MVAKLIRTAYFLWINQHYIYTAATIYNSNYFEIMRNMSRENIHLIYRREKYTRYKRYFIRLDKRFIQMRNKKIIEFLSQKSKSQFHIITILRKINFLIGYDKKTRFFIYYYIRIHLFLFQINTFHNHINLLCSILSRCYVIF